MSRLLQFLRLTLRCIAFLWMVVTLIILGLFVIGSEGDGYSWTERIIIAIKYGAFVSILLGFLLGLYLFWQSWKVEYKNRKTLSKRDGS